MPSTNLAAVIEKPKTKLSTQQRPTPTPGPGELLVRNHAIAVNPVDWKIQDYDLFIKTYPTVLGSDIAGVVESVGPDVSKFAKGDRVFGFAAVIYNQNIDHGAWQTYTLLREIAATKMPGEMSFEEGTTFPMAFATSAIALFTEMGVPYDQPKAKVAQESALLIWGASSSVGTGMIQLGKHWGFKVYATASRKNHDWLRKLGATHLFDYHDKDVVDQIVKAAKEDGTPIKLAYDTVSEGDTFEIVGSVLSQSGGSSGNKLVTVLPFPEGKEKPQGTQISTTGAFRTGTDQPKLGEWLFNDWLQKSIADGSVVPSPEVQVVGKGIELTQKAFDISKAGVSGRKVVVQVE